ncbi:MAG: aminotransferase class IV, partial [Candidatus Saccharimonadales bacterium]
VYTVLPVHYDENTKQYMAFRLADHLRRIRQSAQIVGMVIDENLLEPESFAAQLGSLLRADEVSEDVLARVTLFTDGIIAGAKTHGQPTSMSIYLYTNPEFYPPAGIHVGVSSWRRTPDNCIPARAKINGGYAGAALMKNQALLDGYDDAIALGLDGHVAESTVANIFIVRGGRLVTPGLSADILEGITRDSAICWAQEHDLLVEQRPVDRTELYIAEEVFLTGTSAKITPVLSIDRRPISGGKAGPITKKLQSDYDSLLTGGVTINSAWLTVI